jgi:hypothetical protein
MSAMTTPRAEAWALRLAGLTYAEIGLELGVSRQRAQQLVKPTETVMNAVRAHAGGRCERCGVVLEHGHVHHRHAHGPTPDTFNEPENLEYLCVSCHVLTHWTESGPPAGFYRPRGHTTKKK